VQQIVTSACAEPRATAMPDRRDQGMNRNELTLKIAGDNGLSKSEAEGIVRCVLDAVVEAAMAPEGVSLHGFGKFQIKDQPARKGRNLHTGETVSVPPSRKLRFQAAKAIKDRLNPTGKRAGGKKAPARKATAAKAAAAAPKTAAAPKPAAPRAKRAAKAS
jgi:DNA-binding protein HU-beta